MSTSTEPSIRRVRRGPVALGEEEEIPGHEGCGLDLDRPPLAPDARAGRQVSPERLCGFLSLEFLKEGEDGVQDDDRDDGQRRSRPQ